MYILSLACLTLFLLDYYRVEFGGSRKSRHDSDRAEGLAKWTSTYPVILIEVLYMYVALKNQCSLSVFISIFSPSSPFFLEVIIACIHLPHHNCGGNMQAYLIYSSSSDM